MAPARFSPRPGLRKLDRGIRKTSSTYGRPAFLTHAAKSNGGLAVESPSERLVSQLLGLDPSVSSFQSQPLTLDLLQGELLHTVDDKARIRKRDRVRGESSRLYTPDFLSRNTLGASTAIEVKTEGWAGDTGYQGTLLRARDVLLSHHINFIQVVIPSLWCHPLLTNAPLLHQASKRIDHRPDSALMEKLELLADAGASTLGDFCSGVGFDARMAPVLIVYGALKVDVLKLPLKSSTPAELAYGDLGHLCVMEALSK